MLLIVLGLFTCSCPSASKTRHTEKLLSSSYWNNTLLSGSDAQEVLKADLVGQLL